MPFSGKKTPKTLPTAKCQFSTGLQADPRCEAESQLSGHQPAYKQIHDAQKIPNSPEFFPATPVLSGNDPFRKATPNPVHAKLQQQSLLGPPTSLRRLQS